MCAGVNCRYKAVTLKTFTGNWWQPCCPEGNPPQTVLFVTEKRPTSIAIGWSAPVCGRKSPAPFTAHCFASYLIIEASVLQDRFRHLTTAAIMPQLFSRVLPATATVIFS
jgi:hypothetical protein